MFASLAATASPAGTITSATADLLPQLITVGGAAIAVGAGVLVLRRGWGFFKSLAK